jgi:hypothetical protein
MGWPGGNAFDLPVAGYSARIQWNMVPTRLWRGVGRAERSWLHGLRGPDAKHLEHEQPDSGHQ